MKLIRQTHLHHKAGNSDKVYEVDLCEVSSGQYVVNFRFGRRGGTLQEGAKTVFPVSLSAAEKTFRDLVQRKLDGGYTESHAHPSSQSEPAESAEPELTSSQHACKNAVLQHLQLAAHKQERKGKWKLSRVIWRAGELKLPEAIPFLLELAQEGDDMQRYSLAWSLGRCAEPQTAGEIVKTLSHFYYDSSSSEAVRRIAAHGLCRLQKDAPDDEFYRALIDTLPSGLQETVRAADAGQIHQNIREYLFELKSASNDFLTTLYHLSWKYPTLRETLLSVLADVQLKTNYFNQVRYLFKLAEFRGDSEFYGLLAYCFETTGGHASYWSDTHEYVREGGRWFTRRKANPKIVAYTQTTRAYLRKRVVRVLKRTGEAGDSAYTDMATGVLLRFRDDVDGKAAYTTTFYTYEYRPFRSIEHITHYDSFAGFWAFNFILYANSPRYGIKKGAEAWHCVAPYQPGQPAPDAREEAFPELWTQAPDCLLRLLVNSRCQRVHEFAVKAFKSVPEYAALVSTGQVISMLGLPYQATNELALEIARQRYSPDAPDKGLVSALVGCPYLPARNTGCGWIANNPAAFFEDAAFVCQLIFSAYADIRRWSRSELATYHFSELVEKIVLSRAVSMLLVIVPEERNEEELQEIGDTLLLIFPKRMYQLGLDVIRDLLQHPCPEIQRFAGKILLKHSVQTKDLPEDLFLALLEATVPQVRALGVQLLGNLPDGMLLQKEQMLTSFCLSEFPEIRKAVAPIIGRLASVSEQFGAQVVERLYSVLLFKEAHEGLHQHLYALFTHELAVSLKIIDPAKTWKLIQSKHQTANLLGAYLLKNVVDPKAFPLRQLVELSKNEILELRTFVWDFYRKNPDHIKQEKEDALGIVDADWEDTRRFGFEFFRTTFGEDDWTPELLVSLCDSVRDDVRAFGREMVTRFFDEAHGDEYLLKLSQHPSADVQLFATNYLERFASDNAARIQGLEPYFITLLSQVNKGRVAKDRAFHFLRTEALKDKTAAQVAANVISRQSATLAVGDKATCIEILRDLHATYPELKTAVTVKEVPLYVKSPRPRKKKQAAMTAAAGEKTGDKGRASEPSLFDEVKERVSSFFRKL